MKNLLIKIGSIIGIVVLIFLLFRQNLILQSKISELNNNIRQVYKDMPDKNLTLSRAEFYRLLKEQNDKMLNKLLDSFNIRERRIKQTFDNYYNFHYDTVIGVKIDSLFPEYRFFEYRPDSCIDIAGKYDLKNDSLHFNKFIVNYNSKTVVFWQRETKRGKKIFFPFGHKVYYSKTLNNCKGNSKTTIINVKQK